jgi:hypothetical protein
MLSLLVYLRDDTVLNLIVELITLVNNKTFLMLNFPVLTKLSLIVSLS